MARGSSKKDGRVLANEKKPASAAAMALDNIPIDPLERRREFVDYLDQLEIDKKKASNEYAAHEKRLTEVFGVDKFVQSSIKKLRKMKTDHRAAVLRQLVFFVKDLELTDPQGSLFNDDGQPGGVEKTKDDGAVFDKTGNKAAPKTSETEPVKKLTGAEPPAHVPTPGIPLDEAEKKFVEAKAAGDAKRAAAKSPPVPGAVPKPAAVPTPSPAKAAVPIPTPTPKPAARTAAADAKPTARRTNRKPTEDELKAMKSKADNYIPKPADGDEGDQPGNYKIH